MRNPAACLQAFAPWQPAWRAPTLSVWKPLVWTGLRDFPASFLGNSDLEPVTSHAVTHRQSPDRLCVRSQGALRPAAPQHQPSHRCIQAGAQPQQRTLWRASPATVRRGSAVGAIQQQPKCRVSSTWETQHTCRPLCAACLQLPLLPLQRIGFVPPSQQQQPARKPVVVNAGAADAPKDKELDALER